MWVFKEHNKDSTGQGGHSFQVDHHGMIVGLYNYIIGCYYWSAPMLYNDIARSCIVLALLVMLTVNQLYFCYSVLRLDVWFPTGHTSWTFGDFWQEINFDFAKHCEKERPCFFGLQVCRVPGCGGGETGLGGRWWCSSTCGRLHLPPAGAHRRPA